MSLKTNSFLKNYGFSLLLLLCITIGSIIGLILKKDAIALKPFGDVFLNLLFSVVVPMVFFSISSAVASMGDGRRLGAILGWMLLVFTATGAIASLIMIFAVKIFPPAAGIQIQLAAPILGDQPNLATQLVKTFTVADFGDLLSKKNMMALIIFSLLIGLASLSLGEKARAFTNFLKAGNEVFGKVISYIMFYAPIGLGAYFAYLVGVFGPDLLGTYLQAMLVYYPVAILYFFIFFSFYAWLAAGGFGVKTFWKNIVPVSLTALATGSSVASIPANLDAAKNIGTPQDIREVVIPIGATIHMDGSCLSAILKIALLFGIYNMDFTSPWTILTAVGIALLSGTVMSGIPGGGFLGELMIVTMYGFPMEALPIISMIGTLVDPPATMVNSVGDNVASMMVARLMGGKKWMVQNVKA